MSRISYGRQSDLINPDAARALHVTVCGLGTVGSHAAVELARLGVGSLHLADPDRVEAHNLPSQAYAITDLERPKAEACAARVRDVNDFAAIQAEQVALTGGESFADGPVVLAVDSMEARRDILELSVAYRPNHPLIIDGRMAGKTVQLLAFDPSDATALERWQSDFWFASEQAHPVPCGGRTVSFVGAYVGGLVAAYIARHLAGGPVPFFTQADLETFTVITQRAA